MKSILVLTPLVAIAGALYFFSGAEQDSVSYRTMPLQRADIVTTTTSTGTIEAVVTVEVGSQLSGQVDQLFADFNDEVKKDQPLARLDQQGLTAAVREARAALDIAEAGVEMQQAAVERARSAVKRAETNRMVLDAQVENARLALEKAERDLERTTSLKKKGAVASTAVEDSQTQRDSAAVDLRSAEAAQAVHLEEISIAEAELLQADAQVANARGLVAQRQASLEQAEVQLKRTVIRSPIDGMVIKRNIDRGQTVAASLEAPTLFTIAQDLRRMEVHAKVDEADIGRIKLGQRASFTVDSFPRRVFAGTVTQIRKAPEAVRNVVVYTVLLSAENPDLALLPGMTAVARIVIAELSDVLTIPNAALRFQPPPGVAGGVAGAAGGPEADGPGDPATVWVLGEDGQPRPVPIRTGARDATATQLLAGDLEAGQAVVVASRTIPGGRTFFGFRPGF